jgi:hypothetical protein
MGNLEGFDARIHDAILSRELDIAHAKAIDAILDGGEEVAAAINHALEDMCKKSSGAIQTISLFARLGFLYTLHSGIMPGMSIGDPEE